jgi:hypothetical protein
VSVFQAFACQCFSILGAHEAETNTAFQCGKCDPIAQSAEQLTFNQWVLGSSPSRVTTEFPCYSWENRMAGAMSPPPFCPLASNAVSNAPGSAQGGRPLTPACRPLARRAEEVVHRRRLPPRLRQQVDVGVVGDGDRAVPQHPLHGWCLQALPEQQRGGRVAQVVEATGRQPRRPRAACSAASGCAGPSRSSLSSYWTCRGVSLSSGTLPSDRVISPTV